MTISRLYDDATVAVAKGASLGFGVLLRMDFEAGEVRAWTGIQALTTTDGRTWSGVYGMAQISDITTAVGLIENGMTFRLGSVGQEVNGGVLELVGNDRAAFAAALDRIAETAPGDYVGREVEIYVQYLDAETLAPVGAPQSRWFGKMSAARIIQSRPSVAVEVDAESIFAGSGPAPYSALTDADQQARHPGSTILRFADEQRNQPRQWAL